MKLKLWVFTAKAMRDHFTLRMFWFTEKFWICGNDPSAGSPTETLLRLHLPLDDKV